MTIDDGMPEAAQQADAFEKVRAAHQSETAEDYVELIDDLIQACGEARVVEIAQRLGVSHATVVKVIARLQREGLVVTRPYRSIFLTEAGALLAQRMRDRHHLVYDFLLALGVGEDTAAVDAEGVEHHVSEQTLEAFRRYLAAREA